MRALVSGPTGLVGSALIDSLARGGDEVLGLTRSAPEPGTAAVRWDPAAGALWVIFRADWAALSAFQIGSGEVIYFWGCVAHAIYAPMVRKVHRGEPVLSFTLLTFVAGILVLVAFGWRELLATVWTDLSWRVWFAIGYLSLFASAITFLLIQYAALRLPAAKVMAYTFLSPSLVIVLEALIGHGLPDLRVLPGVVLTIAGLALLVKDEETERESR